MLCMLRGDSSLPRSHSSFRAYRGGTQAVIFLHGAEWPCEVFFKSRAFVLHFSRVPLAVASQHSKYKKPHRNVIAWYSVVCGLVVRTQCGPRGKVIACCAVIAVNAVPTCCSALKGDGVSCWLLPALCWLCSPQLFPKTPNR